MSARRCQSKQVKKKANQKENSNNKTEATKSSFATFFLPSPLLLLLLLFCVKLTEDEALFAYWVNWHCRRCCCSCLITIIIMIIIISQRRPWKTNVQRKDQCKIKLSLLRLLNFSVFAYVHTDNRAHERTHTPRQIHTYVLRCWWWGLPSCAFFAATQLHKAAHMHMYVYTLIYVCVCLCVWVENDGTQTRK